MNEVNDILAYNVFPGEELSRKYAPLNVLVEAGVARVWHWIKSGLAYGMLSAEKHQEEFTAKAKSEPLHEILKEAVGIVGLPTRSLFGGDIPRRLLLRDTNWT